MAHSTLRLILSILLLLLFVCPLTSSAESRPSAEVIKDGAKKSGCDYDPYQKLYDLGVVAGSVNVSPNGQGKPGKGLDISLACRLSKFLEWAKSQGCNPKIISGYRSGAEQQAILDRGASKAGPGASCHNYGLAIDLSSSCSEKLHRAAREFKLASRVGCQNGIGTKGCYNNPNHYQCLEHAGGGGRSSGCRQACDGGIPINPDMGALANINNSPTSPLTNSLRDALGLNKQPPQQQAAPAPQQALPKSQQPTQYFPSTGTTQPGSGTTQSPISALSPESQQYLGVTSGTQPQVSIADQLLQMAYGTSSTPQPQNTGTTVPLILNTTNTGSLQAQPVVTQQTVGQAQNNVPVGSIQPPQTFTSPDLSNMPVGLQPTLAPKPTGMYAVLETMKQTLLRALEILRPMGIRAALQGEHLHVDEYAE